MRKINEPLSSVARAIAVRDEEFIRELTIRQTEAGAGYLDVCAAVPDL